MRLSSIDIGSNAIRLVIVDIHPNGRWEQIKKFRAPLRLGTDIFENKTFKPATILALVETFKKISKLNKKYRVSKTIALATSAMRDSKNKRHVLTLIKKASNIQIKVITGLEEAQIIQKAISKSNSNHFKRALLIDIGGGSAEITGIHSQKILFAKSYPLGVVRLLALHQKFISGQSSRSIQQHCEVYLKKIKKESRSYAFDVAIGTGGNFDAVARLKLALLKKAPQTHISLNELLLIKKKWQKLSVNQKLQLGLRPDRIDVLEFALELMLMILNQFHITHLKIPMTGLKEGTIHTLIDS